MAVEANKQFLRLSDPIITFDSTIKRVYFDPINKQVFCVTNDEANRLKVVVRGSRTSSDHTFKLEDRGEIFSLKFSPDSRILGIQRSQKSIEFVNFDPAAKRLDEIEYSQPVKAKSSKILTFSWFSESEVCFVADKSVEFYAVSAERRTLKALKCFNMQVSWYRFAYDERMLLLFTLESQSVLVPFTFRGGTVERLAKVDIPTRFLVRAATRSQTLLDRDSLLIRIYGRSYYCWLRCPSIPPSNSAAQFLSTSTQFTSSSTSSASEQLYDVFLQEVKGESVGRKMHVLRTASSAKQTLNVVDNLVVIHRPTERRSIVFDIRLVDATDDNGVHYHFPLTAPFTIFLRPTAEQSPSAQTPASTVGYRESWLYFQPDILIDAKVGIVWQFEIILDSFFQSITDRIRVVDFLLNRATPGGKQLISGLVRTLIMEQNGNCLSQLASIFDKLNVALKRHADYAACLRAAGCVLQPDPAITGVTDSQAGVATANSRSGADSSQLSTTSISMALQGSTVPVQTTLPQFSSSTEYELLHNTQFAYARLLERSMIVLEQYDLYVSVFLPLFEEDQPGRAVPSKLLIATLIQYLNSLHDANIEVQHFINNLLATVLAQRGAFSTLQQLIQYGVIADSKQVACLLISLSAQYKPAYQLGIDMLRRLDMTNGDIFDALLVKSRNVPAAIRFVHTVQLRLDCVQLQNLFAKLETLNDPLHFYAALGALLSMPYIRDTLAKADWFEAIQQRFNHRFPKSIANPLVALDKRISSN